MLRRRFKGYWCKSSSFFEITSRVDDAYDDDDDDDDDDDQDVTECEARVEESQDNFNKISQVIKVNALLNSNLSQF